MMSVRAVPALRVEQWEAHHCGRRFQALGKCDVQLQGLWSVNGDGSTCSFTYLCCQFVKLRMLLSISWSKHSLYSHSGCTLVLKLDEHLFHTLLLLAIRGPWWPAMTPLVQPYTTWTAMARGQRARYSPSALGASMHMASWMQGTAGEPCLLHRNPPAQSCHILGLRKHVQSTCSAAKVATAVCQANRSSNPDRNDSKQVDLLSLA